MIVFLCYLPGLIYKGKFHEGYKYRLGLASQVLPDHNNTIWIHAVSVGEVLAVVDFIKKLKQKFPGFRIICSTVTKTGYQVGQENLKGLAQVIYSPLDFSWIVGKFIRTIKPKLYIAAETEIWPNLLTA